jgi:Polymerase beta, Nucleotidyltransferase
MAHQWLKWPAKLELVGSVFRLHPEVMSATMFGSRAKGTHTHRSDMDLVVAGDIEPLRAEAIASEWRSCRCRIGLTCNPWLTFSTAPCWSTSSGWAFASIRRHDSESRDAVPRL